MKIKSFAVIVATCTILCHWDAFGCSEGIFMKEIQLTQGKVAIVNDTDFEWLSQWKWCLHNKMYAVRNILVGGKTKTIRMHRVILDIEYTKMFCDHIDGNGLNNQRSNLRVATPLQNQQNQKRKSIGSSQYKGVHFNKKCKRKWSAMIRCSEGRLYLGRFANETEAALAYNEAAIKYHGEFARLNIIQ